MSNWTRCCRSLPMHQPAVAAAALMTPTTAAASTAAAAAAAAATPPPPHLARWVLLLYFSQGLRYHRPSQRLWPWPQPLQHLTRLRPTGGGRNSWCRPSCRSSRIICFISSGAKYPAVAMCSFREVGIRPVDFPQQLHVYCKGLEKLIRVTWPHTMPFVPIVGARACRAIVPVALKERVCGSTQDGRGKAETTRPKQAITPSVNRSERWSGAGTKMHGRTRPPLMSQTRRIYCRLCSVQPTCARRRELQRGPTYPASFTVMLTGKMFNFSVKF